MDQNYNAKVIFTKLFHDDIKLLLTMDKLWAKRRAPTPLVWDELSDDAEKASAGRIFKCWKILNANYILMSH